MSATLSATPQVVSATPEIPVPLGAALSLVVGMMVCREPFDVLILARRLGVERATPAALVENKTWLRAKALERWPQLAGETGAGVHRCNWRTWLSGREALYGASLPWAAR